MPVPWCRSEKVQLPSWPLRFPFFTILTSDQSQISGKPCLAIHHENVKVVNFVTGAARPSLAVQFGFFLKLLVKFFVLLPEVLCLLPHGLRIGPTRFDDPPKDDRKWDQPGKNQHQGGKRDCPPQITPFSEALDLAEQN